MLERVENNATAIAEWEQKATTRFGSPVAVFGRGTGSSGQPHIWVVADCTSSTPVCQSMIGWDVSFDAVVRAAMALLPFGPSSPSPQSTSVVSAVVPASLQGVSTTPLYVMAPSSKLGLQYFTTLSPNDTSRVVGVTVPMEAVFSHIIADSGTGFLMQVEDHVGNSDAAGACGLADTPFQFRGSYSLTSLATWTFHLGACPGYVHSFITWKRYVFAVVIAIATALCVEIYRRVQRKNVEERQADEGLAEQQLYGLIVGYVCHEVRNPLHVLKSSFETVTAALTSASEGISNSPRSSDDVLTSDEQAAVIADGRNAIAQMQVLQCCLRRIDLVVLD